MTEQPTAPEPVTVLQAASVSESVLDEAFDALERLEAEVARRPADPRRFGPVAWAAVEATASVDTWHLRPPVVRLLRRVHAL